MRLLPHISLPLLDGRHRLADLMELYEGNYRLLQRLIPGLDGDGEALVSAVSGCVDLHLTVLERHKYTTILSLTYLFERDGERIADPDLVIRLYHDARVAEVAACGSCVEEAVAGPAGCHGLPDTLERKWAVNLLLEKWLAYCLGRGHCFVGEAAEVEA